MAFVWGFGRCWSPARKGKKKYVRWATSDGNVGVLNDINS